MDVSGYRNSGELSDISIKVNDEEFHLHKFPLYVRSNYFKNLTSNENNQISKVDLSNFPGGSKTFAVIADYCYNKEIRVNGDNVIPVRCGAEFLDMNNSNNSNKNNNNKLDNKNSNLTLLADNVLYDLLYQAKGKRDYKTVLNFLNQARDYPELAEKCELDKKLINAFAENLNSFVRSSSIYDKVFDKSPSSYNRLHNLSLSAENIQSINNLPLKWMNELVRALAAQNLNNSLLTHIVQNYIDANTGNEDLAENIEIVPRKPSNLIGVAADILKVEKNLSKTLDKTDENGKDGADGLKGKSALVNEIGEKDKPLNLINVAADILKVEKKLNQLVKNENDDETGEVSDDNDKLNESKSSEANEAKPKNLISVAGEILDKTVKPDETSEDKKPNNLIQVAGEILAKNEEKPKNLIDVASEILEKKPVATNSSPSKIVDKIVKPKPTDQDKLKVITSLTNTLNDLKIDPQFSLPWLLRYVNELHDLNADPAIKAAFNRWTWNAINDPKNSSHDLSEVKPEVMVQIAKDAGSEDKQDQSKLIDFVDRYIGDLDNEKKLDPKTFSELASSVPKDKRESFDKLAIALVDLLEKDSTLTPEKRKELIDLIDFSKVNENTLEACKKSKHIPTEVILDAALELCKKLRKELDEAKSHLKPHEYKARPTNFTTTTAAPSYTTVGNDNNRYSRPSGFANSYTNKYSSPSSRNRSYEPKVTTLSSNYDSKYDYPYYSSYVPSHSSYGQSTTRIPITSSSTNINNQSNNVSAIYKSSPSFQNYDDTLDSYDRNNHHNHHHHHYLNNPDICISGDLDENTSFVHELYSDDNECHDYFHATYSYSKVY